MNDSARLDADIGRPPQLAFSLGDLIGVQGGIGRYRARQEGVDRKVFADVLMTEDAEANDAYVAHVQALGRLSHPVVPRIHAFGRLRDGRLALVHQFRDGVPWAELLENPGHPHWWSFTGRSQVDASKMERLEAHLRVIIAICHGLQHAREHRLAHGYLVPSNIILGDLGDVQVIGWEHAVFASETAMAGDMVALGAVLADLSTNEELWALADWARNEPDATPQQLRLRLLGYLAEADAHTLCGDADDLLAMLKVMQENPDDDTPSTSNAPGAAGNRPRRLLELRIKTLFSMANLVRPEHPKAVAGLLSYHRLMAGVALDRGDIVAATHHLKAQTRPDPKQAAAVADLRVSSEALASRATDFEELLSASELAARYRVRSGIIVVLGLVLGLTQLGIGALDATGVIAASHRMYAVLMATTALGLYIVSRHERFEQVLASDPKARAVRGIMVAAMAYPALFWVLLEAAGVSFRASLTLTLAETGIVLAMGGIALHGALFWPAIAIGGASFLSALVPGYEFEMLGGATFLAVSWVGFIWTYRVDGTVTGERAARRQKYRRLRAKPPQSREGEQ